MRKVHKILDLLHEEIKYEIDSPLAIELCRITHSPVHCHDASLEMALCLKGEVNICCNHEWLTLSEGEIYTIVARDIHCFWSDTGKEVPEKEGRQATQLSLMIMKRSITNMTRILSLYSTPQKQI